MSRGTTTSTQNTICYVVRPPSSRTVRFLATVAGAVLATSTQGVVGFASIHNNHVISRQHHSLSSSCLQLSTKEEIVATPLSLEPISAASPDALPSEPSSFTPQNIDDSSDDDTNNISLPLLTGGAAFLLLLSSTANPSAMMSTYSNLLIEYPLPTKSLTSGALCGVSDVIAQFRDETRKEFNYGRLIRFAGKGCIGGIIWSFWYDNLDRFLDVDNEINLYTLSGVASDKIDIISYQWIRDHIAIVTTALSILIEQFFWCPVVFGAFELPVSTLMNGGSLSTIQKEVDSKLNGLLVSNAKVWTLANVVIYNTPVQWRPAISNFVDVLWQSIVSDVAADCGKVDDDICEIGDDMMPMSRGGKNYSFYAEKSRL